MRVLVTGSREWQGADPIFRILMGVYLDRGAFTLVHGACPKGADLIASRWAQSNEWRGIVEERHPADWDHHGRKAGVMRNQEMVNLGADLCLAFIADHSRGATHCARAAEKAGIPTRWLMYVGTWVKADPSYPL